MKLLFKFFLIPCFLMTVLSCEVQLDANTRILVEGIVKDQDNVPISEAKISVLTKRGNYSSSENQYILGEGYSNADGHFSVISLYDGDEDFAIEIDGGDTYSTYVYKTNTLEYTPLDLTFNLETVNLKKTATFNYDIVRTSGTSNTLSYSFKYLDGFCLEYYDGSTLNEYQSSCYQEHVLGQFLNDNNSDTEWSFSLPLGEVVTFTYSINDEPEQTEFITINQDNYDFTFNY
ncbi:carboxypeptidase-like regulatory domain-containing protein [Winogradskyella helgolandensis]|uniref:carboxypeptidase-like regulatory domain-containing protein n=1 Tax=Winogradskyella helgolandensis TaxID=2697010 RepID=UPI0015BC3375|nr:carboxypeptidase-like regulatory domain-containing protein [Winogradskyella helgolandensis]